MTTPLEFTKNKGWGRVNNKKYPRESFALPLNTHLHTSNLHRHSKRLNPSQAPIFDLLPMYIIMVIKIWVSGLEHRDKFKPIVSRINNMCNPILFEITHNLWTPYHNFGVFRWYN